MIFDLVKKSFNTIVDNPSITFYFVLFLIITNFLALYITTSSHFLIVAIVLSICSIILSFAFCAGWFQVVKESVNQEKIKEKNYFSIFFEGIGKNIIPVSIGIIIYFSLLTTIIIISSLIANAINPNLEPALREIASSAQGMSNLNDFLSGLSNNQKFILYAWQLGFIIISMIYNFILLYYFPSILDEKCKNIFIRPFWALKNCISFLFQNFTESLGIFLVIYFFYFLIGFTRTLINPNNSILLVFLLFVYIYFISSVIMLIFNYYEQKNLCNNRTNSLGENKSIDCISKED